MRMYIYIIASCVYLTGIHNHIHIYICMYNVKYLAASHESFPRRISQKWQQSFFDKPRCDLRYVLASSTCYQVLGTKSLVLSTRYQVRSTKCLIPDTWYQVQLYQVPGTRYLIQTLDTQDSGPSTWNRGLGTSIKSSVPST